MTWHRKPKKATPRDRTGAGGAGTTGAGAAGGAVTLYYGSEFGSYDFGSSHPLQPDRHSLTHALLDGLGLTESPYARTAPVRPARVSELLTVHSYPYVQAVWRAQRIVQGDEPPVSLVPFGLGTADNPLFAGMYDAASLAAGTSIQAAEDLLSGTALHACNFAGGLHHALPSLASGFCIFNDAALAIARLREAGLRVAYVDLDAHHSDGVQEIFYEDPGVLMVSVHESGRFLFPGTGAVEELGAGAGLGTSINVPLPPHSGDDVIYRVFSEIVEPALRLYLPAVLVTQVGTDAHWKDGLAHLAATLPLFYRLGTSLHSLAHELCGGTWLILGGGGYSGDTVTPRAWAAVVAAAQGLEAPEGPLPDAWIREIRARGFDVPASLLDDPGPPRPVHGDGIASAVIRDLQEKAFPLLQDACRRFPAPPEAPLPATE